MNIRVSQVQRVQHPLVRIEKSIVQEINERLKFTRKGLDELDEIQAGYRYKNYEEQMLAERQYEQAEQKRDELREDGYVV